MRENAISCDRNCINYRPVYLQGQKELHDFMERAKSGDALALVVLQGFEQRQEALRA